MSETFYINLPKELSEADREDILSEIRNIEGVEESDLDEERAIDPVSITMYITIATTVLTLAEKALPFFERIMDRIKGKGIKDFVVTLPDDTKIAIKEGSAEDVKKIAEAFQKRAEK